MWSGKWLSAVIFLPVLVILVPSGRAATATATVIINATFTMPTCTLTMPDIVPLGDLKNGTKIHSAVQIGIDCPDGGNVETGLYARKMSGELSGTDKMTMVPSSGSVTGNPALFWLTERGGTTPVKLDGTGADVADNAFCRGTAVKRTCSLTPVTQVFADTVREEVSATVRFNVMYP